MKSIELNKQNLRFIRKQYFHLTLKKVAQFTQISYSTIRNAELGKNVRAKTIKKLFAFYERCEEIKQQLRAQRLKEKREREQRLKEMFGIYV